MVIITSHTNLDFDGLASMIAARKLHPQGIMVYSGKLNKNVNYFMSLHKDVIKILPPSEIDLNKVSKLIVVDTSSPKRTGKFSCLFENSRVEKIIYDHHNKTEAGATVTKLVEKIKNKNLSITLLEATVFALGIYEDTGFFRYSITTPRDLSMAAYLLEKGANLQVISDFLEYPLSETQQSLLEELISNSIILNRNGINILLAWCETSHYVEGLASIASKLYDIRDCQVVILTVKMDNRVFITARSKVDNLDLAGLLSRFNGGGHKRAASAVVKSSSIESIISEIKTTIKEHIVSVKRAKDIMSTPVKTIPPESSINEAYGVLIKYGHTGLPVVKNDKLIGIISRRDIEKAKHFGLGHAPVKGFMRRKVITISENTSIYEIQELMINNNIGRLPVIEKGKLKGIVTRTDILRELHGSTIKRNSPVKDLYIFNNDNSKANKLNLKNTMKTKLDTRVFNFLIDVGKLADKANVELYVVGGFVRDLLLEKPNLDVDLVVVGDGINFAKQVAHHFNAQITVHKRFETASIHMKNEKFKVDISTARREFYEYPAALPKVERSSIKFDLYRRDFTINSMAVSLNQDRFGDLFDYFGGKRDLEEKLIRVLHSLSFIEDPTRIFRAIRFEQRLNFNLEAETCKLAGEAIKDKAILELTPERIRDELMLIFQESTAGKILYRLEEIGLFKNFFIDFKINDAKKQKLIELQNYLKTIEAKNNYFNKEFHPVLYLSTLMYDLGRKEIVANLKKLKFPKSITRSVLLIHDNVNSVKILTSETLQPSQIYDALKRLPVEALIWYSFFYKERVEGRIAFYLEQLKDTKLIITGNDLKKLGIMPGAVYNTIKSQLIKIKIDKGLKTKEEELKYAKKIYEEMGDDEGA